MNFSFDFKFTDGAETLNTDRQMGAVGSAAIRPAIRGSGLCIRSPVIWAGAACFMRAHPQTRSASLSTARLSSPAHSGPFDVGRKWGGG